MSRGGEDGKGDGAEGSVGAIESLTAPEAAMVVELIAGRLTTVAGRYNERKYPPDALQALRVAFATPNNVTPVDIRAALVWKFGHFRKPRIPKPHEDLAGELARHWPSFVAELPATGAEAFSRLEALAGGETRFITVSFLVHLMFPDEVPIIDQHNFRCFNYLMKRVRRGWKGLARPKRFGDIERLGSFMRGVREAWPDPGSRPDLVTLDRFMMMHGKELKRAWKRVRSKRLRESLGGGRSGDE